MNRVRELGAKCFRKVSLLAAAALCTHGVPEAAGETEIQFNRDIRPILSDTCFACHGPDKNTRKAKLRLDIEEEAKRDRDGYRAIDVAKPLSSELLARIASTDDDERMPPPDSGKKLTPRQIELLKQWVEAGAPWEGHWAYIPPQRPPVPAVQDSALVENEIDHFIIGRLKKPGLKPSSQADRRSLIRRVSLDLIGLPPTPEEVEAFVSEESDDAYEKVVDRLLQSPHYGEQMAVPWLDVVRFADTVGYHGDQQQNIYPYRDYVIDAFNKNKPFDEFTLEQLAGDLLPEPTEEQLIASGFNRLNMMTREGGAQPKEYLAKYAADRVRTVSTTWMASTMGCAECHDHKFDPFTMRDFYSMEAFFADLKEWGVYADYRYTPNPDLKGFNNDYPFPPEIEIQSRYLKDRRARLRKKEARLIADFAEGLEKSEGARASFEEWCKSARAFLGLRPDGWAVCHVLGVASEKKTAATVQDNGSIVLSGKPEKGDEVRIELQPLPGQVAAIRLEVLPHAEHENSVARGKRKTFGLGLSATLRRAGQEEATSLQFYHADADKKRTLYSMGLPVIGIRDRWESNATDGSSAHTGVYWLAAPFEAKPGDVIELKIRSEEVGCIRVATTPFAAGPSEKESFLPLLTKALEQKAEERSSDERQLLSAAYLRGTAANQESFTEYKKIEESILECRDGRAFTMVSEAWEPSQIRILPRGNWQDESGDIVQPAVPEFLGSIGGESGRRATRLDLGRWLVAESNPLTARVFVNRLWKQFFGTGLSGVLDDLGSQGEWPTHSELLDWLAVEFRESGWDVKHMVKLIVMSRTYRQTSQPSDEMIKLDPLNRFLARQSPRRLPAEFVRDHALAVSRLLNRDIGGPSGRPYQPAGYYANLNFPQREYEPHLDDRQYRRGVYMHWQRTFLHPMLASFDAPSREECTADRVVSNTPQQALTLLNDPGFVEAARAFAERILAHSSAFSERLNFAFQQTLARPAKPRESESLRRLHEQHLAHYRENPEEARKLIETGLSKPSEGTDPIELAAWTSVSRVLFNLHETVTRY